MHQSAVLSLKGRGKDRWVSFGWVEQPAHGEIYADPPLGPDPAAWCFPFDLKGRDYTMLWKKNKTHKIFSRISVYGFFYTLSTNYRWLIHPWVIVQGRWSCVLPVFLKKKRTKCPHNVTLVLAPPGPCFGPDTYIFFYFDCPNSKKDYQTNCTSWC